MTPSDLRTGEAKLRAPWWDARSVIEAAPRDTTPVLRSYVVESLDAANGVFDLRELSR